MKVLTIVGTRPNFVKEISLSREFKENNINEILLHTGQHYDYNMYNQFFDELDIPEPNYTLDLSNSQEGKRMGDMIGAIEDILIKEKPEICVVMGDVHSTMAGAIAAAILKIPIVHIEAGVRGDIKSNPEEVNRRVADTLSDLLLTNCESAKINLINEGYSEAIVHNTGDLMKDTLNHFAQNKHDENEDFILATIHRQENTDNQDNLVEILDALIECKERIVFPVHPRTKKKLIEFNFWDKINTNTNIKISDPLGYLDFIRILSQANKVVTDSGGVRREAYLLGKPIINCGPMVWFPELIDVGWKVHTGPKKKLIIDAIKNFKPISARPNIFGDGYAAKKIVSCIINHFNK